MFKQGLNSDGELLRGVYVEHDSVPAPHAEDGRTRQEFKDECDINVLLARYETTGTISHFNDGKPAYLDVTLFPDDLAGALLAVEMANESFMRLPAHVRRDFDNDAVQFAEFAADPANVSKMREWGLAAPERVADASGEVSQPDHAGVAPASSAGSQAGPGGPPAQF